MSLASPPTNPAHAESAASLDGAAARRSRLALYLELTKARLSLLVLLTTAVGFILGAGPGAPWWTLLGTLLGTALAAACANALNQVLEADRDGRMRRTRERPLPSGGLAPGEATLAAFAMGIAGIAILVALVNVLAAWLALITIALYVVIYTPLKTRSTLNTLVGAVCGGLPPMIGWAGATGTLDAGAWWLGAVLFVWQLPHFLALAWLYRRDYERGGFVMLPILDPDGSLSARVVILSSLALLPLTMLGVLLGLAGWLFAAGAVVLGLWLLKRGARLYRERSDAAARGVFLASILYLALLLLLVVVDRGPVAQPNVMVLGPEAPVTLVAAPRP